MLPLLKLGIFDYAGRKGKEASIILPCEIDNFYDKILLIYCINPQTVDSMD
jgi:hypothetical protein